MFCLYCSALTILGVQYKKRQDSQRLVDEYIAARRYGLYFKEDPEDEMISFLTDSQNGDDMHVFN